MPCPPERPTNPRTCHGASCIHAAPEAPPAYSRAPALPIPSAPDRPQTSADTLLKPAPPSALALTMAPSFVLKTVWTTVSSVLTSALPLASAPAPAQAPLPSLRPAPESLPNAASAFFSLPDPPLVPNFGGYPRNLSPSPIVPILCYFRQA